MTEEHILPDGLGGRHTIPRASCRTCQKIINEEVEQYCQRELFGNARFHFGLRSSKRSRRKRPRPRLKIVVGRESGEFESIYPDEDELPVILVIPAFPPPTILRDEPAPETFQGANWIYQPEPMRSVLKRFSTDRILSPVIRPALFARLIAKIGHAHGTAHLGDAFDPVLPPLILGKHRSWLEYVGGNLVLPPVDESLVHQLSLLNATRETDGKQFAVAGIRLFAGLGAPLHYAVLGPMTRSWPVELVSHLTEDETRTANTMLGLRMGEPPKGRRVSRRPAPIAPSQSCRRPAPLDEPTPASAPTRTPPSAPQTRRQTPPAATTPP